MFAANYDGLKKRETYDEIVEYLQYGQEKIKYPDRKAKQLRESPQLSNLLDGDGQRLMEMEGAQDRAMKNQQVEHLIREASKKNRVSAQLLRSNANQFMSPQHFDIACALRALSSIFLSSSRCRVWLFKTVCDRSPLILSISLT